MRQARFFGVVGILLLLVAAVITVFDHLSGPPTEFDRTPTQIIGDAAAAYLTAPAVTIKARYTQEGHAFELNATSLPGAATGSLIAGPDYFDFVSTEGRTWLHTDAGRTLIPSTHPEMMRSLSGTYWYLAPVDAVARGAGRFIDRAAVVALLSRGRTTLKKERGGTIGGRATIRLFDDLGSVFIAATGRPYPVALESAHGALVGEAFAALSLTFSDYGRTLTVAPPAKFVDPNDPATFPALFKLERIQHATGCSAAGCTVGADIHNQGGAGTATLDMALLDSGGRTLATCTAPVPSIQNNATVSVTCHAGGPDWAAYFNAHYYSDGVQFSVSADLKPVPAG